MKNPSPDFLPPREVTQPTEFDIQGFFNQEKGLMRDFQIHDEGLKTSSSVTLSPRQLDILSGSPAGASKVVRMAVFSALRYGEENLQKMFLNHFKENDKETNLRPRSIHFSASNLEFLRTFNPMVGVANKVRFMLDLLFSESVGKDDLKAGKKITKSKAKKSQLEDSSSAFSVAEEIEMLKTYEDLSGEELVEVL